MSNAPTIDSLGDHLSAVIRDQFATICRTLIRGPEATSKPGVWTLVTGEPHPLGNFAIIHDQSNPSPTRRAVEVLGATAAPSAMIFPHGAASEINTFIGEHGFALAETMPAMAVDLDDLARPAAAPGYELIEIDCGVAHDGWNEALEVGYGVPRRVAALFGPGPHHRSLDDACTRYFTITKGDDLVATSMIFTEGGVPGVYCVSTLPDHRGKGLGAWATAAPLQSERERGRRLGVLQSSAMGESVYRWLGFRQFGAMHLYVRMPGESDG